MRLVVDTNVILSSLIRDSASRKLFLNGEHVLYIPEHALAEVERHLPEIARKAKMEQGDVQAILEMVLSPVEVVPESIIIGAMSEANSIMLKIDPGDVPFIACALAIGADGIITYDKDFSRQKAIRVFTPEQL